jgi:hypothetical protein
MKTPTEPIRSGQLWRHTKTGWNYRIVCLGLNEADQVPVVCYQATHGVGPVWVRPMDEFLDGRFERVPE